MVLGAQLWPLSAIFDLRRLAARTGREHGNDVVCPLLLTSEINKRYSLAFVVSKRDLVKNGARFSKTCDIRKPRLYIYPLCQNFAGSRHRGEEDFGVRVSGPDGLFSAWIQVYNPCFKIDVFHSFTCCQTKTFKRVKNINFETSVIDSHDRLKKRPLVDSA